MRATVEASALSAALKHSAAVTGKTTNPILQHALLSARDGKLSISTTDCEVFVRTAVAADVEVDGEALLHAGMLRPVADGGGSIRITSDGKATRGRSHYKIPALSDLSAFPTADQTKWELLDLTAEGLADAIRHVAYTGDDDDVRPMVKAIHVMPGAVWATDGNQLGRVSLRYDGPQLAIPVYQIKRVLEALQPGTKLYAGNIRGGRAGQLRIDGDVTDINLRLLQMGQLPNVETFVPRAKDPAATIIFKRTELIAVLRRFTPFSSWTGAKHVTNHTVVLALKDGELTLTDRAEENREDLTGLAVEMDGTFRVGLDPRRLVDALNAIRTSTFTMYLGCNSLGAALMVPAETDQDEIAHILMPMRI
ncbi:MAG TPA: hypothetical protein VLF15_10445 [Pseudoxanthomonas sp.]|nr:hypothetical protein [Pseudoxanthomonas sp.]